MDQENLVVLDASVPPVVPGYRSVNQPGGAFAAIPGARRFDYDKQVCLPNSSLPHMMPGPELFQEKVRAAGVNQDSVIVVYDDVDTSLHKMARLSLSAHLIKLHHENRALQHPDDDTWEMFEI